MFFYEKLAIVKKHTLMTKKIPLFQQFPKVGNTPSSRNYFKMNAGCGNLLNLTTCKLGTEEPAVRPMCKVKKVGKVTWKGSWC